MVCAFGWSRDECPTVLGTYTSRIRLQKALQFVYGELESKADKH